MSEREPAEAVLDHAIPAGAPWSAVLHAGQVLRIVDLEGQQAVDALFYAAGAAGIPAERYSMQDTLLGMGAPYIEIGARLMSSEGRVMATVVADTCGRHDTLAGCCSCESNSVRFGRKTRYLHACRENFILELGRHGMGKRDIVPNVNFFMNVPISEAGELAVVDGFSAQGGYVELRAEMELLVVLSNCPQLNNPCNGFNPTPIRVLVWD